MLNRDTALMFLATNFLGNTVTRFEGASSFLTEKLGLSEEEVEAYFRALDNTDKLFNEATEQQMEAMLADAIRYLGNTLGKQEDNSQDSQKDSPQDNTQEVFEEEDAEILFFVHYCIAHNIHLHDLGDVLGLTQEEVDGIERKTIQMSTKLEELEDGDLKEIAAAKARRILAK